MPIPLIIGAAMSAYQIAQAAKQRKEAKKAEKYMPAAASEATNIARAQANVTRAPGQDIEESNIRQATSDAFTNVKRGTRSSGDLLNTAARLQLGQNRATQALGQRTQAFRQSAMDRYRGALGDQANIQMGNRRYAEALRGAAAQNSFGAVQSVLGGLALSRYGGGGFGGGMGGGIPQFTQQTQTPSNPMSRGAFGYRFDPNRFSSFRYNPGAFSANYNFR